MKNIKIVVTDYIEPDLEWEAEQFDQMGVEFQVYQNKFATPEELIEIITDADVAIVNMAKITSEVINGLSRTRLIIRHGVGYDNVDVNAAAEKGIQVARVPDYCVDEVAEQAVMLIFACQRKLTSQIKVLGKSSQQGEWDFEPVRPIYSLSGKTLGLIGCGRIGSRVYEMMQGVGMECLIDDPYLSDRRKKQLGIETVTLEEVLKEADVITIHAPLNEETYHLLDQSEFELMKPTATLVNTARGGIVNLRALDKALKNGELAFAGVDVYEEKEPPDPDFPLLLNERAICTPHLAWMSVESDWSIREKIVEDVRRFVRGESPRFPISPNPVVKSWE
ncbi:MAG: C-terminal binding protein [Anaerolineales bacterium]|jgi:D-3-phosphoglycerate dehydrogenase